MKLKIFNKSLYSKKLENKNNIKLKRNSIIISILLLIGAIIYFTFARFEATKTYSLINGSIGEFGTKLVDYISNLNETDLVYDGVDTLGELGTVDNNLRYVGVDPNNYVYYNCSTTNPTQMSASTCEKWRIVGVFNNVEDENGNLGTRIKIVKNTGYTEFAWDSSASTINNGSGINQWGPSTYLDGTPYEGSDLMRELNNDYLGNIVVGTDGYWYGENNNVKNAAMLTPLNSKAQSMIETVKWYTSLAANGYNRTIAHILYEDERSGDVTSICTASYCNDTVIRTPYWIGKVALIYASDYMYATSGENGTDRISCAGFNAQEYNEHSSYYSCRRYNWLKSSADKAQSIYTITPLKMVKHALYGEFASGNYLGYAATDSHYRYEIKPALYLKNNVIIKGGSGTTNNPYKIAI